MSHNPHGLGINVEAVLCKKTACPLPKSSNGIFRKSHVAKVNGVGNLAIPTDVG